MGYGDEGFIFDLDMTLVDTSSLKELRERGEWSRVKDLLGRTFLFPGVKETIDHLKLYYRIGVVTSSPRGYAEQVLSFHGLEIPVVAAYHDTVSHKPDPEPYLHAIKKMKLNPSEEGILVVGDHEEDMIAGVETKLKLGQDSTTEDTSLPWTSPGLDIPSTGVYLGCVPWGENTSHELVDAGAEIVIQDFTDLMEIFGGGYGALFPPLALKNKDQLVGLNGQHYLVLYFPYNTGFHDLYSRAILEFKKGSYGFVNFWRNVVAECFRDGFRFKELPEIDYVVRALSSGETEHSDASHPLDAICEEIADSYPNATYLEAALKKTRRCRELKLLSFEKKKREIDGIYFLDDGCLGESVRTPSHFLIVDDVLTTGTTAVEIAKVLRAKFTCLSVSLFTLAKTSRPEFSNTKDNKHFDEFDSYLHAQFEK